MVRIRPTIILVTIGLFLATVIAVGGSAFLNWRYGLSTHDKIAVINTVVAIGAFALVAWGVIVALAAYVSATGYPDLTVRLYSLGDNPLTFKLAKKGADWTPLYGLNVDSSHGKVHVDVINNSEYAARNPGVRIMFRGLVGISEQKGWELGDY